MNILFDLMVGFVFNLIIGGIIIRFIYYPSSRNQEFVFTLFAFNILIYFVSGLLRDVQLGVGFGFGLLAVFSILRYRTMRVPIREMTYLFICVTFPFMNTLFQATRITFPELVVINFLVLAILFVIEKKWGFRYEVSQEVLYENIELIRPENYTRLMTDLQQRIGRQVKRCEIKEINFLRDTARLMVYYEDGPQVEIEKPPTQQMNHPYANGYHSAVEKI